MPDTMFSNQVFKKKGIFPLLFYIILKFEITV